MKLKEKEIKIDLWEKISAILFYGLEDSNRVGMKGVTMGYLGSKYFNSFFLMWSGFALSHFLKQQLLIGDNFGK